MPCFARLVGSGTTRPRFKSHPGCYVAGQGTEVLRASVSLSGGLLQSVQNTVLHFVKSGWLPPVPPSL